MSPMAAPAAPPATRPPLATNARRFSHGSSSGGPTPPRVSPIASSADAPIQLVHDEAGVEHDASRVLGPQRLAPLRHAMLLTLRQVAHGAPIRDQRVQERNGRIAEDGPVVIDHRTDLANGLLWPRIECDTVLIGKGRREGHQCLPAVVADSCGVLDGIARHEIPRRAQLRVSIGTSGAEALGVEIRLSLLFGGVLRLAALPQFFGDVVAEGRDVEGVASRRRVEAARCFYQALIDEATKIVRCGSDECAGTDHAGRVVCG